MNWEPDFINVFGTRMTAWTFALILLQIGIAFYALFHAVVKQRKRIVGYFVILGLLNVAYNLSNGLLPNENSDLAPLTQYLITYGSGILLAVFYFWFLIKKMSIPMDQLFNPITLLSALVISFFFGFVLTFQITGSEELARKIFAGFPCVVAIYFCWKTVAELEKLRHKAKKGAYTKACTIAHVTSYVGIIFMATMPFPLFFGYLQFWNLTLVSMAFFLTGFSLLYRETHFTKQLAALKKRKAEEKIPTEQYEFWFEQIDSYQLTPRELEIGKLICSIENLTFEDIAKKLVLAGSTVSKHASNIYKKVKVSSKAEFKAEFREVFVNMVRLEGELQANIKND